MSGKVKKILVQFIKTLTIEFLETRPEIIYNEDKLDRAVGQICQLSQERDREWIEAGDALLDTPYWAGKFSAPEIRQFWQLLKERV